jgi:hypothetical protein
MADEAWPEMLLRHHRTWKVQCYACGAQGLIDINMTVGEDVQLNEDDWLCAYVQWTMSEGPAVCTNCITKRITSHA